MMKIGIIGAGPSGIFTAINLKNENNEVYLIDKNKEIGKKLAITGNGRCNITNIAPYEDFLDNIIRNRNFMYSSFSKFDNYSLLDFLSDNEIETVVENDGKVFPKSMKSTDIIEMFEDILLEKKVKFISNTEVESIKKSNYFVVTTNKGEFDFDYLVLATGGKSYPKTGSTGDGYTFAKRLGHKIIDQIPSLVPIHISDGFNIKALNLRDVTLNVNTNDKAYSEKGDLLLTKRFLTGPITLKAQARASRDEITDMWIDLFPKYSYESLEGVLLQLLIKNPKKNISNVLKEIINESLAMCILDRLEIDINTKANQLEKENRKALIDCLKCLRFKAINNTSFNSAVVTSGGVDVSEINPKTMESKLVDGLYIVGELLDVDALTGGFNLQIAFTTGYAASLAIRERK
ncbi:NAD(P)/FAD-dependent oxidoreductase [uncultured Anaerococcus sp.]|uniref:NAD(P)/FAD-dependent oxidoreductase n=1 Tax=uncultured Anaerococcus sp. TaxID=293428 RepID=UPI00280A5A6F|nr:NAD(P)/FAD-dependent oxidoreductase [uncultured Anaerococcus sp.]MDU5148672.1 NAD(P)/FAD-dependent oxidoreductase [Anaerococcus prevotii]